MINALILVLAFIGDIILGNLFTMSFIQLSRTITPNLLFIALILVTYKTPKFQTFMTAIIVGLVMDSFNKDILFLYTIINVVIVFIVRAWSNRINNSIIEMFLLVLSAVFVKEILIYFYYTLLMGVKMSFNYFMLNHLAYTLLFNLIFMIVGVIIKKSAMDREMHDQLINKRRASIRNEF